MPKKGDQPEDKVKKNPVGRPELPKLKNIAMPKAPEAVAITKRYIEFVHYILSSSDSTLYALTKRMRIQQAAFFRIMKDPEKYILPVYAIWWAMEHENLNLNWLFTGKGEMINQ